MKIAIVGTGIAGLTCGYYLSREHEVEVFEANDYIGGHTHTVDVEYQGEASAIDTGFIVFNDRTYPHFMALLSQLGVAYQPTSMGFSVRNDGIGLEYNGNNLNGLFAQRTNIVKPAFLRFIADIIRFNRSARQATDIPVTLGEFIDSGGYGALFGGNYLLPMVAAIWSMGIDQARDFPLPFFVKFFNNHGLLDLFNRPQWYSIIGGSRTYIAPLTAPFADKIHLSEQVRAATPETDSVLLTTAKGEYRFDQVILACHGDEALAMRVDSSEREREVLGAFTFSTNEAIVHTDTRLLPQSRRAWASWNYRVDPAQPEEPTLTYDMNILQRLDTHHTYLVSLNADISPEYELARFTYGHPRYTEAAVAAQARWAEISGVAGIHYCGAYWFNGFHEDGVKSGLRVCAMLGVTP
ncbi:MAG TPA: FAD-dependent oxidoreductase [Desulfofustis sp.]|jgi:predicted NAD/FAD-binding protein|nr:FAD-dependent oxidoreductase [Desulfofustis sp.]